MNSAPPILRASGHRYQAGEVNRIDLEAVKECILDLPQEAFHRYENPFERKWALREKYDLPLEIERLVAWMENDLLKTTAKDFEVPLYKDYLCHYLGVFKYDKGDKLDVHVDAGIHPKLGLRKHVTVVLYLGEGVGDLELWSGTPCTVEIPRVKKLLDSIAPVQGNMVIFENTDYAWHGAASNTSDNPRLVVTVSYLSNRIDQFRNQRRRAYFVPRPDQRWTSETYKLRDTRADTEHYSEAYRV